MTERRTNMMEVELAPSSSPSTTTASGASKEAPALTPSESPPSPFNSKTTTSRPRSKSLLNSLNASSGHKRTSSGNILSRFPFFRTNTSTDSRTIPSTDSALHHNAPPNTPPNAPAHNSGESTPSSTQNANTTTIPFPAVPTSSSSDTEPLIQQNQQRNPVLASVIDAQSKTRKRKGSLRKTAILMGNHLRLDHRRNPLSTTEKDSPSPKRGQSQMQQLPTPPGSPTKRESKSNQASPTKKTFTFELPSANSSSDTVPGLIETETGINQPQSKLSLNTNNTNSTSTSFSLTSKLLSPINSPQNYDMTTPESDVQSPLSPLPLSHPPAQNPQNLLSLPPLKMPSPSPSPPSSESSLTAPQLSPHIARRRKQSLSLNKPLLTSPLAAPIIGAGADFPTDEWDYSETEWWGWIILIVTWIVVVVGMGSCLGVWSWAWDVGKTPYAPPELEDDPTLPIVGYYPALMVLTAVMSWVWVVVAWVGMKYFKHAKIQNDDT